MPDETRSTAEAYIAAANAHDPDAMVSLWAAGGIEEFPALGTRYRAPVELRSHFAELFESIPDVRFDVQQLVVDAGSAVVLSRMSGTHNGRFNRLEGTGRRFELLVGDFLTIDDGIRHNVVLFDGLSVLRQLAGFPPPNSKRERALAGLINAVAPVRRSLARRTQGRRSETRISQW